MEFLVLFVIMSICVLVVDYFNTKEIQAIVDSRPVRPVIVSDLTANQLNKTLEIKKAMDAKTRAKIADVNAKNRERITC